MREHLTIVPPIGLRLSGAPLALQQALTVLEANPHGKRHVEVSLGVISAEAFAALVEYSAADVVTVEHEGHAWERLTFVRDDVTFTATSNHR